MSDYSCDDYDTYGQTNYNDQNGDSSLNEDGDTYYYGNNSDDDCIDDFEEEEPQQQHYYSDQDYDSQFNDDQISQNFQDQNQIDDDSRGDQDDNQNSNQNDDEESNNDLDQSEYIEDGTDHSEDDNCDSDRISYADQIIQYSQNQRVMNDNIHYNQQQQAYDQNSNNFSDSEMNQDNDSDLNLNYDDNQQYYSGQDQIDDNSNEYDPQYNAHEDLNHGDQPYHFQGKRPSQSNYKQEIYHTLQNLSLYNIQQKSNIIKEIMIWQIQQVENINYLLHQHRTPNLIDYFIDSVITRSQQNNGQYCVDLAALCSLLYQNQSPCLIYNQESIFKRLLVNKLQKIYETIEYSSSNHYNDKLQPKYKYVEFICELYNYRVIPIAVINILCYDLLLEYLAEPKREATLSKFLDILLSSTYYNILVNNHYRKSLFLGKQKFTKILKLFNGLRIDNLKVQHLKNSNIASQFRRLNMRQLFQMYRINQKQFE